MPLIDITRPDVIKFLIESYDKTTRLRMKWNNLNSEKLKDAATLHREEKGYFETDVLKSAMVGGMEAIRRDHKTASYNRRRPPIRDGVKIPGIADMKKGHSIPEVGLGNITEDPKLARPDTNLSNDPIMRPITPKQRQIIYDGIPENGRVIYLKARHRIPPEKKFYFSECSGWDYGWRLSDSPFTKNAPAHGRVWRLYRDVRSRSGPQPDPRHYVEADVGGFSKCLT